MSKSPYCSSFSKGYLSGFHPLPLQPPNAPNVPTVGSAAAEGSVNQTLRQHNAECRRESQAYRLIAERDEDIKAELVLSKLEPGLMYCKWSSSFKLI